MVRILLVLIFRVLVLAVGSGLALLVGIAIAMNAPNQTAGKPAIANFLPGNDADTKPTSIPQTDLTTTASPPGEESKELNSELEDLQAKLKKLPNRTANRKARAKLEKEIKAIEAKLDQSSQDQADQFVSTPFFSAENRVVSLPLDALFEDSQTTLRPTARPILDKLAGELKNYPKSTIRIFAHTDDAGDPQNNRTLSFRQAQVVEQYLSDAVEDSNHWLVVGYGESQPIAPNDTPTNSQRNRRIEIAIK